MAEVIRLIDPDGGAGYDYLSLALWITGEGGDVTGTTPVAEFTSSGGSPDTSYVSLNTAFTNPDEIIIRPASPDQYATEAWNDSIYRVVTATGGSLLDGDITIEGLQINYTGNTGLSVYSTNYTVNINRCFIRHSGTGTANVSTFTLGTGCQLNMTNTILTNNSWEGQSVNGFSYGTAKARNFFNVTIRHTGGAVSSSGFNFQYVNTTDNHIYNCAITGGYKSGRGIWNGSNADEDYNAVTDSSIDGTHSLTGQTDADFDFTDTTATSLDLSFATTSVLKDAGYDLSATFTDSINGVTRPQNSVFDIGAYEFEVLAGGGTITASLDALVRAQGIVRTASLDAILQKQNLTTSASLDAMVQNALSITAAIDSAIKKQDVAISSSLDAMAQKLAQITASVDAVITASGLSVSSSMDAVITSSGTSLLSSLDALLQKSLAVSASLDALVQSQGVTVSASADAVLQKTGELVASMDAVMVGVMSISAAVDAMVQRLGVSVSAGLDAFLSGGLVFGSLEGVVSIYLAVDGSASVDPAVDGSVVLH